MFKFSSNMAKCVNLYIRPDADFYYSAPYLLLISRSAWVWPNAVLNENICAYPSYSVFVLFQPVAWENLPSQSSWSRTILWTNTIPPSRTRTGNRWWSTGRRACWTSWTRPVRRSTRPWEISTCAPGKASFSSSLWTTPNPLKISACIGNRSRELKMQKRWAVRFNKPWTTV